MAAIGPLNFKVVERTQEFQLAKTVHPNGAGDIALMRGLLSDSTLSL